MGNKRRICRPKQLIEHWHIINLGLMLYDILAVNFAFFAALFLRFDCQYSMIPSNYLASFFGFAPIYTVMCMLVFWFLKLYKSIWRFASYSELLRVAAATVTTGAIQLVGITVLFGRMPISYYTFGIVLQFFAVLGIRFSYRLILLMKNMQERRATESDATNVMIIGAGSAGRMIAQELIKTNEIHTKVCCFIDDNPNKWNRYIEGVPVVGNRDDILKYAEQMHIDQILFAIPTASPENKRDILNICKETGCELKTLPGIYQLVNGAATMGAMKKVTIDDLLGRPPIETDMDQVY